jgi:FAD/FMN-containing dehydrogenase
MSTMDVRDWRARFEAILDSECIIDDPEQLARLGRDLSDDEGALPLLVLEPVNESQVACIVRECRTLGLGILIRGGGMSYSLGYANDGRPGVLLSMAKMSRVISISSNDMLAVVEAGCTWLQLDEALRAHNLESVIEGPVSGERATVGGGVAQVLATSIEGILGLRVILPDGSILPTGACALSGGRPPFHRNVGPDLTGLFTGDSGAFGIKTTVALRTRPRRSNGVSRSFGFTDAHALLQAAAALARSGRELRCIGIENWRERAAAAVVDADAATFVRSVARNSRNLLDAVGQLARIARRRRKVGHARPWTLHIIRSSAEPVLDADRYDAWLSATCVDGVPVDSVVAEALRLRPYDLKGITGPDGERWLPVHGVLPPSRAVEGFDAWEKVRRAHAERLDSHGIRTTMLVFVAGPQVVLEPMFLWRDRRPAVVASVAAARMQARWQPDPPDPVARAVVMEMRGRCATALRGAGAVHLQLGRYYPLHEIIDPQAFEMLRRLKTLLDPQATLAPGNLGLGGT